MRIQHKYPLELESRVVEDYKQGIAGYKKLAKKYGMNRDVVRRWVLKDQKKCFPGKFLKITKSDEFKSLEEEVKYLRDANMYWQAYAEIILEDNLKSKKKAKKSEQSSSVHKKKPAS